MKLSKKLVSYISVFILLLTIVACRSEQGDGDSLSDHPTTLPSYERYQNERQLALTAFWSPPITDTHYSWIAECGFNEVIIDAKYDALPGSETMTKALNLCAMYGLKGYQIVNRGGGIKDAIKPDYSHNEGFGGIYTDEPLTKKHIDIIAENDVLLKEKYPNHSYRSTLVPNVWEGTDDFASYDEYIEYYMDKIGKNQDMFAWDIYPLKGNELKGYIYDNWLLSIETIAKQSKKYGVGFNAFISSMSIESQKCRRPAEDDLRYTSYVNLAYGAKGISYFCFMTPGVPPFDGEFITSDWALVWPKDYEDMTDYSTYERTKTYYFAQKVNNELKSFDHVLLSYQWQGVMASRGTDAQTTAGECFDKANDLLSEHERIQSVVSSEDTIIGCFNDGKGYDGFMVVNFADPILNPTNDISIKFKDATKALVYINGEKSIVTLTNGEYRATFASGEGRFIIPIA